MEKQTSGKKPVVVDAPPEQQTEGEKALATSGMTKTLEKIILRKQGLSQLLPRGMNFEWFVGELKVALVRNSKLCETSPESFIDAITTCAQLGLSPSGRLGSAYLIPYGKKCQLVVGYQGYMDLAYRSGDVIGFEVEVVYEKDQFTFRRTENGLRWKHIPTEEEDPGKLRAVYAIAFTKNGGASRVLLFARDVLKVKNASLAKLQPWQLKDAPWVVHEAAMWMKTAIRRLWKLIPKSPQRAVIESMLVQLEETDGEIIDGTVSQTSAEEPTGRGMDRVRNRVAALSSDSGGQQIEGEIEQEREKLPITHERAEPPPGQASGEKGVR